MSRSAILILIFLLIMIVVIQLRLIFTPEQQQEAIVEPRPELPIMPIICVTRDSFMPYSEREVWVRDQVISLGTIIYSQEEIDAEAAAKVRRRKK